MKYLVDRTFPFPVYIPYDPDTGLYDTANEVTVPDGEVVGELQEYPDGLRVKLIPVQ